MKDAKDRFTQRFAAAVARARAALSRRGGGFANEITRPCPKCHRQLRADGGCTSCERRALLDGGLKRISPSEANVVLSEPVEVRNPANAVFRFTKEKLLSGGGHLKKDHSQKDYERRARVMLYAFDTARTSKDVTNKSASRPNGLGVYAQRKEVRKRYVDAKTKRPFEIVVRADSNGEVYEVFDVFPR